MMMKASLRQMMAWNEFEDPGLTCGRMEFSSLAFASYPSERFRIRFNRTIAPSHHQLLYPFHPPITHPIHFSFHTTLVSRSSRMKP